jgi:crossover junction endodeoxyribonuclease RuvC
VLVAIEGYAMGSRTRPQMAGELGGHLRLLLWQAGIPYIIVPPTSLKKYVLGKGNAAKELMLKEVFRKWGYDTTSNDRADAYALARIAAEFAAGGWTKKFEGIAQGFECVPAKGSN